MGKTRRQRRVVELVVVSEFSGCGASRGEEVVGGGHKKGSSSNFQLSYRRSKVEQGGKEGGSQWGCGAYCGRGEEDGKTERQEQRKGGCEGRPGRDWLQKLSNNARLGAFDARHGIAC